MPILSLFSTTESNLIQLPNPGNVDSQFGGQHPPSPQAQRGNGAFDQHTGSHDFTNQDDDVQMDDHYGGGGGNDGQGGWR